MLRYPGSESPGGRVFFRAFVTKWYSFFQAFLGHVAWFFSSAGGLIFFKHWPTFFLTFAPMKRFFLIVCYVLLLWIILFTENRSDSNSSADLLEAYKIASAEAIKWDGSAKPYFITSVDDPIESRFVKGEDGKRNYWNFDFVAENSNKHLIVTLQNKTVVNKIEATSNVNSDSVIYIEELRISTADAAAIAKEKYGLLPGTDWAQGYHFVLENDGSVLILSVAGLNADGNMARVFFNAKTGEVIR